MRVIRLMMAVLLVALAILAAAFGSGPQRAAATPRQQTVVAPLLNDDHDEGDDDDDEGDDDDDDDDEGDEDEPAEPITSTVPLPRLDIASIDARFKARWERGGGIRIYGLPLTEPVLLEEAGMTVQYFERARFEYHPEYAGTEYEVLLGLLGVELGYRQPVVAGSGPWYFPQTGHEVAPEFRDFWRERGLMALGYPIGESMVDGNGRVVQYFERVRLEYHPEHAGTEYVVLLGLLGEEQIKALGGDID